SGTSTLMLDIRKERAEIEDEMERMLGLCRSVPPGEPRPLWRCRRCGHEWLGYWPKRPPCGCPRCHSIHWRDDPLLSTARRPSDPPNPKWYQPRQTREKRLRLTRESPRVPPRDVPTIPGLEPPPKLRDVMKLVAPEAVRFADNPSAL